MPQIGDSLAGRMEVLTLLPLSLSEIKREKNTFLAHALANEWPSNLLEESPLNCLDYALIGGYPEMLVRHDASRRAAWGKAYIKAIVERDVKE